MSTAEIHLSGYEYQWDENERAHYRSELLDGMQAAAAPGQDHLDDDTVGQLRVLTRQLVDVDGERAAEEYDRYNATKERGLELPEAELKEWLGGKTILVTGGTGLIGSTLMSKISQYGPDRLVSISRGEMEPVQWVAGAEYWQADVRDGDRVKAVMHEVQPDIVFHVAADKYNHEAEKRARHTLTTNINGTQNIIEAASDAGVGQLVYASTGKATRPFSPDIYASSKKTGEWLMSQAARQTGMTCSAVRFTHVVDHSNVRHRIHEAIDDGSVITIQDPEVLMYVQSARESADLLLNSGLETHDEDGSGALKVHAIRELGMPINLPDLAIGALVRRGGDAPVYFKGVQPGYEDKAWFGLYDPLTGGDVSPLINAIEAPAVTPSTTCEAVDTFPLEIRTTPQLEACLEAVQAACGSPVSGEELRAANHRLAWAMLDGRLSSLPLPVLARAAQRIERMRQHGVTMTPEHEQTNEAILAAVRLRS